MDVAVDAGFKPEDAGAFVSLMHAVATGTDRACDWEAAREAAKRRN
jgi:hypothetical protein